jgi:feruloyl esterase
MNPDGSINTALWQDFAERSLHQTAEKTKALVLGYYGKPQRFAYWDGYSTGGRQGMKLAQVYPKDYDGIASGAPAINWTRFITGELYPQIVMRQDLGANIAPAKIDALSTAAINACGGATLGFLVDPLSCRYDPTKDAAALCSGVNGNAGAVGTNATATCSTLAEATAVNKIWYGQTADGSVPDPATDNGSSPILAGSTQIWFGLTRGTSLGALAGNGFVFPIATDQVALELQDPTYAQPNFLNGKGNGANKWTTLTYGGLTNAAFQGVLLQSSFSNINTDNADLSGFSARKGKLLLYHGLADNLIAPQGSINYYNRVAAMMGGIPAIQSFFSFYLIPGMPHNGSLVGPPTVPMPQNAAGRDEMFTTLQNWVEHGTAPAKVEVTSANGNASLPLCVYPQKIVYDGAGAQTAAASYSCK